MSMNVVARSRLAAFWTRHPQASAPLATWYRIACHATWTKSADVHNTFNDVDFVKGLAVFNASSFRIICDVHYPSRHVYIRDVFTHAAYDVWTKQQRKKGSS